MIAGLAAISLHQHDLPRHQLVGGHSVLRDLVQLIVSGNRGLYRQAAGVRHQLGILIAQDERIAVLVDEASALDGQGLGTVDADVAGHVYAAVHRNGVAVHGISHGRRQIVITGLAAVSLLQHDLPGSQRVGVFRTVAHGIDIVRRLVAAYHGQRRVSSQDRTGSAGQLEGRVTDDLASTDDGQRLAHLDLAVRRHILQHSDGRVRVRVGHGGRQAIIVCRVSILYIPDLVSLQRVDVLAGCGVIRHQTECTIRGFHGQCRIGGQLAVHAVQQEHITALVQLAAVYHDHILCDRLIRRHSHRVVEAQRTTGLVDLGHRRRQLVSGKAGMLAVLVDDHDSAFLGKQLQRQLGFLQADHAVYLPIAGNRGRLVEGLVGRILIDAEFRLEASQRCAVAVDIQLLQQPARSRHAAAVGRQAVIAFTDSLIRLAVRSEAHADCHLQEVRTQAHSLQCRKHLRAGDLLHSGLQRRRIVIVIERLDRVLQLRPQAVAGRQAVGYGDRHQRRINGLVADLNGHVTAAAELCLHGLAAQLLRERDPIQAQAGLVGRIDLDDPRQLLQRILQLLVVLLAVAVQEHIQRLPLGLAAVCAAGNTDGQIIAALGLIHRHIPCRGGQTVTDRGVAAADAVRQILEIQQRIQQAADQVVDAVVIVRSTLAGVAQHVIQQIIAHGIAHMELAVLEQSGDVLNSRVIQRMAVHGHLLRRAVIVQQQIGGQVARQRRHGVFIRIPQRLGRSLQRHIDVAAIHRDGVVLVADQTILHGVAIADLAAGELALVVRTACQHHVLHLAGDSAASVGVQNAVHHEVVCLILLRADNIAAELVAAEIHVHILAVDTQRTAAILQQHHERGVFLDGGIQIGQEADPAGAHHYGRVIGLLNVLHLDAGLSRHRLVLDKALQQILCAGLDVQLVKNGVSIHTGGHAIGIALAGRAVPRHFGVIQKELQILLHLLVCIIFCRQLAHGIGRHTHLCQGVAQGVQIHRAVRKQIIQLAHHILHNGAGINILNVIQVSHSRDQKRAQNALPVLLRQASLHDDSATFSLRHRHVCHHAFHAVTDTLYPILARVKALHGHVQRHLNARTTDGEFDGALKQLRAQQIALLDVHIRHHRLSGRRGHLLHAAILVDGIPEALQRHAATQQRLYQAVYRQHRVIAVEYLLISDGKTDRLAHQILSQLLNRLGVQFLVDTDTQHHAGNLSVLLQRHEVQQFISACRGIGILQVCTDRLVTCVNNHSGDGIAVARVKQSVDLVLCERILAAALFLPVDSILIPEALRIMGRELHRRLIKVERERLAAIDLHRVGLGCINRRVRHSAAHHSACSRQRTGLRFLVISDSYASRRSRLISCRLKSLTQFIRIVIRQGTRLSPGVLVKCHRLADRCQYITITILNARRDIDRHLAGRRNTQRRSQRRQIIHLHLILLRLVDRCGYQIRQTCQTDVAHVDMCINSQQAGADILQLANDLIQPVVIRRRLRILLDQPSHACIGQNDAQFLIELLHSHPELRIVLIIIRQLCAVCRTLLVGHDIGVYDHAAVSVHTLGAAIEHILHRVLGFLRNTLFLITDNDASNHAQIFIQQFQVIRLPGQSIHAMQLLLGFCCQLVRQIHDVLGICRCIAAAEVRPVQFQLILHQSAVKAAAQRRRIYAVALCEKHRRAIDAVSHRNGGHGFPLPSLGVGIVGLCRYNVPSAASRYRQQIVVIRRRTQPDVAAFQCNALQDLLHMGIIGCVVLREQLSQIMALPSLPYLAGDGSRPGHPILGALIVALIIYRVVVDLVFRLQFGQRQRISIAILAVCNIIAVSRRHLILHRYIFDAISIRYVLTQPRRAYLRLEGRRSGVVSRINIIAEPRSIGIPATYDAALPSLRAQLALGIRRIRTSRNTHSVRCRRVCKCRGRYSTLIIYFRFHDHVHRSLRHTVCNDCTVHDQSSLRRGGIADIRSNTVRPCIQCCAVRSTQAAIDQPIQSVPSIICSDLQAALHVIQSTVDQIPSISCKILDTLHGVQYHGLIVRCLYCGLQSLIICCLAESQQVLRTHAIPICGYQFPSLNLAVRCNIVGQCLQQSTFLFCTIDHHLTVRHRRTHRQATAIVGIHLLQNLVNRIFRLVDAGKVIRCIIHAEICLLQQQFFQRCRTFRRGFKRVDSSRKNRCRPQHSIQHICVNIDTHLIGDRNAVRKPIEIRKAPRVDTFTQRQRNFFLRHIAYLDLRLDRQPGKTFILVRSHRDLPAVLVNGHQPGAVVSCRRRKDIRLITRQIAGFQQRLLAVGQAPRIRLHQQFAHGDICLAHRTLHRRHRCQAFCYRAQRHDQRKHQCQQTFSCALMFLHRTPHSYLC